MATMGRLVSVSGWGDCWEGIFRGRSRTRPGIAGFFVNLRRSEILFTRHVSLKFQKNGSFTQSSLPKGAERTIIPGGGAPHHPFILSLFPHRRYTGISGPALCSPERKEGFRPDLYCV